MGEYQTAIQIGTMIGQMAMIVFAVYILWGRQTRLEQDLDRKLNNGIRAEMAMMQTNIALIQQKFDVLPKRKTDE
jgi:hypothetical protein